MIVTYNLRFPGQYYMAETGLNYNWHRDYDPLTGKYIESDLIGLRGGINTYAYVGSNPLSRKDPLGLDYWVEGTGPEDNVPGHQRICVGKYPGPRTCIEFAAVKACPFGMGCDGAVGPDDRAAGPVYDGFYSYTPDYVDDVIKDMFISMEGTPGRYFIVGNSCRDFAQSLFVQLQRTFGHAAYPPTPPQQQPPAPRPGYGR